MTDPRHELEKKRREHRALQRQLDDERAKLAEVDRELIETEAEVSLLQRTWRDHSERAAELEARADAAEERLSRRKSRMSDARVTLSLDCEAVARVQRKLSIER